MDKRVSEAIESMLAEHTFVPEALKTLQGQLDKVKDLERDNRYKQDSINSKDKQIRELELRIEELTKRADQAEDIANKRALDAVENSADRARADTYEKCFELVFRNAQIRRSVTSNQPFMTEGGYVQYSEERTETVEEES